MVLSNFGESVEREWHESFALRRELFLDEFILMPNHLHAIIIINPAVIEMPSLQMHGRASLPIDNDNPEKKDGRAPLQFIRKPKFISSFIGGYKSATANKIDDFIDYLELPIKNFNHNNKFCQSKYQDHIIHNEKAYQNIKT